jgi:hypothetical protein
MSPRENHTPARPFRIPDEEYDPALAKAKTDPRYGSLTAVVRERLREYVEEDDE